MDKIEKIRKKIKELRELSEDHNYYLDNSEQALGYGLALDDIGKFLDSLPEQPVTNHREIELEFRGEKVTVNREFYRDGEMNYSTSKQDDNVIWAALRAWCEKKGITAFELYPQQPEQPVEGLDEEIATWIPDHVRGVEGEIKTAVIEWGKTVARHFAEWGEKNAYKAIMKKADEVRDKRFDADYEVKIEPAAGFDLDCVNVYHEGKLVGQYVEPKEENKLPEDLEEAAEESWAEYEYRETPQGLYSSCYKDGFIAGAKWMKEKMMEKAVEGVVMDFSSNLPRPQVDIRLDPGKYHTGDKVRVIVIKED